MRALLPAILAVSLLVIPTARAQDPGQILGLILGEVERQADRQRQRQWQREQQRRSDTGWQTFVAQWRACFNENSFPSCEEALATPNIGADNVQRLTAQRDAIIAAAEARQQEARRAAITRQEEKVRDLEAAQARLRQARRELEADRHQAEEQRLAAVRAYASALDECRRFVVQACERAATSSIATVDDRSRIASWRQLAETFAIDRNTCRTGSVEACDRAALSPAASVDDRRLIADWRAAASPWSRMQTSVAHYASAARDMIMSLPAEIAELPRSTLISSSLAAVLAAVLGLVTLRQRAQQSPQPSSPSPQVARVPRLRLALAWLRLAPLPHRLRRMAFRTYVRIVVRMRRRNTPQPATASTVASPAVAVGPRDPETALAALQLAHAYFDEFGDDLSTLLDDPDRAQRVLNTLSLISQQLAMAERADASTVLVVEHEDGGAVSYTLPELKARSLYTEAICRSSNKPRRAIDILEQAAAFDPAHTGIPYFAGLLHMELMHKRAAIAAFERALALDPDNLQYRKMLVRAQSLSGAEVVYHKAAAGVQHGVAAARLISLLLHLTPLVSFVLAVITAGFAKTPEGKAIALIFLAIFLATTFAFMLVRRARHALSVWYRENGI